MNTHVPHAEAKHRERLAEINEAKSRIAAPEVAQLLESGLTHAEVAARVKAKLDNQAPNDSSRTIGQIMRSNLFTLFNLVLGAALVVVLLVGNWRDALFGFIVIANAAIGVVQEYRAKRTLDKLAVLHAPKARVLRDGDVGAVDVAGVVYQDTLILRTGDQVPADAVILRSHGLEVDESLLTGESDPIDKSSGDEVLAGSAVVSGHAVASVNRIGVESFTARLTAEAKRFSLVNSEIRNATNKIVLYITWALVPIIALVLNSQIQAHGGWMAAFTSGSWREAVVSAVAAIVAMIPEGLVLLTSISFGLAALTLARRQVLVQELPAVEGLARVDILCLDKTGTLTEGRIVFDAESRLSDHPDRELVLGWVGHDENANATAASLREHYPQTAAEAVATTEFSSARKYSAVDFGRGAWVLGAPEMLLSAQDSGHAEALRLAAASARTGKRALVLAHSELPLAGDQVPGELEPVSLLTFTEQVRHDAAQTLQYFREQGVALRVISGDNPATVAAVARQVGFGGSAEQLRGYDARELPEDQDELGDVLEREQVLGRVTPEQKKAIVAALQRRGHVVAMTGDGVNDALALKNADIGIAMGSGAAATKAVSRLVLLDGKFSRMPGVVAQGRRVIANVERVANLFLTKTAMAIAISLVIGVLAWPYPFLPRQLSVISGLTIGIPAFFLALLPNKRRYQQGFLKRVLAFTVPAGLVLAGCVLFIFAYANFFGPDSGAPGNRLMDARTASTLTLLLLALYVLSVLARPFDRWRALIVATMLVLTVLVFVVPLARNFFALSLPSDTLLLVSIGTVIVGAAAIELLYRILKSKGAVSERE